MRLFRVGLTLLFMLAFFSCARPAQKLSGIVVYGHEVRTVRLCGQPQVFWMHMTSEQRQQLVVEIQKLSQDPYREHYIEFNGETGEDAPGEFAKEYEGTIIVTKINKISAEIPTSCTRNESEI